MTLEDPGSVFLAPSIDERTTTCPNCGHEFAADSHPNPDQTINTLLAVCDVLVVKALEKMGWYLLRADRGRFNELDQLNLPHHEAHTVWTAKDDIVTKALKNAWAVVPMLLDTHGPQEFDADRAVRVLDRYVHDLVVSGTAHDLNVLAVRIRVGLGLPVFHIVQAQ